LFLVPGRGSCVVRRPKRSAKRRPTRELIDGFDLLGDRPLKLAREAGGPLSSNGR
jgi:hypothetical protein